MNKLPLAIFASLSCAAQLNQEQVQADLQVEYNTGLALDILNELVKADVVKAESNTDPRSDVEQEPVEADLQVENNTDLISDV